MLHLISQILLNKRYFPLLFLCSFSPLWAATLEELDTSFNQAQWNDVIEISHEFLKSNPHSSIAKIKGAYGLFQKGYSNSALVLLKTVPQSDWKQLPQGHDRLVEIVSLFQKKVPLNLLPARLEQMSADATSPYFRNEIHFVKGREAYEKGSYPVAIEHLQAVSNGSRFFGEAHYLLGAIRIQTKDYLAAQSELSKVFEPAVYEQSSEFWNDLGSQISTHWGSNLKVLMDADLLSKSSSLGELSLMGLARVAYASRDFETALRNYNKISTQSKFHPRATLEKVWTLLALNQHIEAEKAAATLAVSDESFEAIEARTVRALILADYGRTQESREELKQFFEVYEKAKNILNEFRSHQFSRSLPLFIDHDLKEDQRLEMLKSYQKKVMEEIDGIQKEDLKLFPAFSSLPGDLYPLSSQAKTLISKLTGDHVLKRLNDLEKLYIQARLIMAETFLEDREQLRAEFKKRGLVSEEAQKEHDQRLVDLLNHAVQETEQAQKKSSKRNIHLEFRQSELLWELGTAYLIIDQSENNKIHAEKALELKKKSLVAASEIVLHSTDFIKHSQALFFTGFANLDLGYIQKGTQDLESFVKLYPKDFHIPDAYRILADMKFDVNQFSQAQNFYKSILNFPDSPILGYALYKIGWCAYNLKDFGKALLGLEKAIIWANNDIQKSQLLTFKKEARHDLISVYAEVGDSKKAAEYFSQFIGGDITSWVLDLARELDSAGQYEKSRELYQTLISINPVPIEELSYQASIAYGYYKLRRWTSVLESVQLLVDKYRDLLVEPNQSAEASSVRAEKVLREIVLAQQFEMKRVDSSLPGDENRVLALDQLYLSVFKKWPTSQEPLFEHAHFLLQKNKISEAVQAFTEHWIQFNPTLKEPQREEALRTLLSALEKSDQTAPLLARSLEYLSSYPNTKYTRSIAFLYATTLLKTGQLAQGIQESQKIFDSNPTDSIGKKAFKNLLAAYNQQKDWQAVYNWSSQLLREKKLSSYFTELQTVREQSLFLWAENSQDHSEAANLYLKATIDPSMKHLKDKAYYNAFIQFQKGDHKLEAIQIAERMEKENPQFDGLTQISGLRSALYQEVGDYAKSLPLLLSFLSKHDPSVGTDIIQQAYLNAAVIYEAIEKPDDALKFYNDYLKNIDRSKQEGTEAKRGVARIQKLKGNSPVPEFKAWITLSKKKNEFEKTPLSNAQDLGARIKGGANRLEQITKTFLDTASSKETPPFYAFESYCSLPFLYDSFSQAIVALGKTSDLELKQELLKVSNPINSKAIELAKTCIDKSIEAEHSGLIFRLVNETWGWEANAELRKKVFQLISLLDNGFPWFDLAKDSRSTESEILENHFKNQSNVESWYRLALLRWENKKAGLSRLTLVDALSKYPKTGKFINALGCMDLIRFPADSAVSIFSTAAQNGSLAAWANLALIHLKGARLEAAKKALEKALSGGIFDKNSELKKRVKELITI